MKRSVTDHFIASAAVTVFILTGIMFNASRVAAEPKVDSEMPSS